MKHHAEFMQASVATLKLLMSLMVIHVGLGQAHLKCSTALWQHQKVHVNWRKDRCFQRSDFHDAIRRIVFSVYEWSTGTLTATETDDSL